MGHKPYARGIYRLEKCGWCYRIQKVYLPEVTATDKSIHYVDLGAYGKSVSHRKKWLRIMLSGDLIIENNTCALVAFVQCACVLAGYLTSYCFVSP